MAITLGNISKWKFVTSSSNGAAGGPGIAQFGGEFGTVVLEKPGGGNVSLAYAGVGAGLGKSMKMMPPFSYSESAEHMPSEGDVFLGKGAKGQDPSENELRGPCVFAELSGGIFVGGSISIIFLGGSKALFAVAQAAQAASSSPIPGSAIAASIAQSQFLESCKLIVFYRGVNVGLQAGAGIMNYIGMVI